MPVSQVLNPKGLIKKPTNNDLPFAPQQPVIASYYATSTAAQTVINLSFSVDTTNSDIFWLFVDGKKLDLGASNDYTFSAIGADLTSAQVTLNQALAINLNIQAFKFGLKKESEFLTDSRFTQLYAAESAGFQGFINPSDTVMTATTTTGTPAAGTFYSSITNRASIIDLSQDMKARMGIERIMVNSIYQIQNEFGSNGEMVWGALDDTFGQIRLIGNPSPTVSTYGAYGLRLVTQPGDGFIEITFYGTALNVLTLGDNGARTYQYALDGGSLTTYQSTTINSVPGNRNYAPNGILSVAKGLTLGVHTIKLQNSSGSLEVMGFEIVNESSNVTVNPGVGYVSSKKYVSSAASAFSYSSVVTGTRGGRVLVYQNGDGSIGKAWQPTNGASALLASADHTNEEVARTYYPREFGAGRLDDFSRSSGAQVSAFTLDDGTTSLSATSAGFATVNALEGTTFGGAANSFIFTFVGTGLDIQTSTNALVGYTFTYAVDGSAAAAITFTNNAVANNKIVSGLPYGSHTFKLTLTAATSGTFAITKFTVYQPKKPSLPSATVEVADYNVMANFSTAALTDNTLNGALILPVGTLYKAVAREFVYTGANWTIQSSTSYPSGWDVSTSTNNNQPANYTFFGTGAVLTVENSSGGTFSVSVSVDGSLFATATALQNISNAGGGTYTTTTTTSTIPGRVSVSGLTLGMHTITVQRTAGTGSFFVPDVSIITPIHSYKSNLYADLQNTLPIGSNALSDNRKITPVKEVLPSGKAWAQAIGMISGPTTSSTSFIPLADMSVTVKTSGGPLHLSYSIYSSNNTLNNTNEFKFYVNGAPISGTTTGERYFNAMVANGAGTVSDAAILNVGPGTYKVDVYWCVQSASTATALGVSRILVAQEK